MKRIENVELTVLCLIYRGDEILLQNRIKKDWQGYTLPGGHVERGESITKAVIREMKEETGLDIYEPKLCGVKQFPIDDGRYIVFLYKTDKFSGEMTSSDEGKMEWIKRSELDKIETVSDFAQLLRVFDEDSLSEFQYVIKDGEWIAKLY